MSKPRRRKGVYPQKVRCKATNRWGEQCRKWAMRGSVVCNKHGGAAPQVRKKAQERIAMAQDDAASLLVRFMLDDKVPFAERRRCAEFLLNYEDRNKVEVTLAAWQENIQELFYDDGQPDPEIVEGVLVENEPRALPASDRPTPSTVLGPEDSEPSWSRPGRYRAK